ncbi:chemotaxis-specific protein-glutamate methyltransferase CheB [Persicobacter psychrovividus]|uniref:Protein-glutamate methylesterase/protein-glutamine glutaminase n=1 Tax=Persicobacter psychrovividus TaxID=387638 RepID=A0ABN6LFB5_9BACT|nr:chemotaxis response regulator protein-glutamate methylesterase [Persicobacter psychrovividus]
MQHKKGVLVVDDSSIMRHLIKDVVEQDESLRVVGTANNGRDAVMQNESLRPDILLLDMNMGGYDGLFAVKQIMNGPAPVPIIILSALGNTDMDPILTALKEGAFDYVNKSADHHSDIHAIKTVLFEKIRTALATDVSALTAAKQLKSNTAPHTFEQQLAYDIICVGASTGGPSAVEAFVTKIPENLPVPIVITQHMPASFIPSFGQRLNSLTKKKVIIAKSGTLLEPGAIYLLPGGVNTVLREVHGKVKFRPTKMQFASYNEPSIDGLISSAVDIFGRRCIGVIMTGMGRDGAEGMLRIHHAGGLTVAQSEESCVVYGMPKAANHLGAIQHNIKLQELSTFVISAIS